MSKTDSKQKTESIIPFLLGESSYKGAWFGDSDPLEQSSGKWWWRTILRNELSATQLEGSELKDAIDIEKHLIHVKNTQSELREKVIENLKEDISKLELEVSNLKTVMVAASEEIQLHWEAHCDEKGYGPSNLMHRLEKGLTSRYSGYSAGAFDKLRQENEENHTDAWKDIYIRFTYGEGWLSFTERMSKQFIIRRTKFNEPAPPTEQKETEQNTVTTKNTKLNPE